MLFDINAKYREGQEINNKNDWKLKVLACRIANLGIEKFGVEYLVADDNGVEFWGDAVELENL